MSQITENVQETGNRRLDNKSALSANTTASHFWDDVVEWEKWSKEKQLNERITQLLAQAAVKPPKEAVFSAEHIQIRQWLAGIRARREEMTEDIIRGVSQLRAAQRKVDTVAAVADKRLSEFSEILAQMAIRDEQAHTTTERSRLLDDESIDECGSRVGPRDPKRRYPDSPEFVPNKAPKLQTAESGE